MKHLKNEKISCKPLSNNEEHNEEDRISTKQNKKAFTLVELIVVVTILAILTTIGFISFKNYSSNARDGARLSALDSIKKGLELFQATSGILPMPDGEINTGTLNGVELTYVGNVGENVTRLIKMNSVPLDPLVSRNYLYGISSNKKYYQVAAALENPISYKKLIPVAYASSHRARVVGNHKYPLKLGNKLYTLPSLIYIGSPAITDNSTGFVIDGGENLPYSLDNKPLTNTKTAQVLLREITGTNATLSVIGINTPDITAGDFKTLTSSSVILQRLQQTFGIANKDALGFAIYGNDYSTAISSGGGIKCPPGFVKVPGNPTFNTTDFCVAKYEMTYADNMIFTTGTLSWVPGAWAALLHDPTKPPVSMPGNYPITNLTQQQAIDQCRSMGPGYHLITNNERMTIARNIESVADNWSGGSVGVGGVYRGITGESNTTTSLGCATSNSLGHEGRATYVAKTLTTDTNLWGSSKSDDCDSKRQHKLSNGSIIWDLAGNVREHVDRGNNPNTTTVNVGGSVCGTIGYWYSNSGPASVCGEQYGPIHRGGDTDRGMGGMWGDPSSTNIIFLRGGSAHDATGGAGIFTFFQGWTATSAGVHAGFRCAFSY